MGWGVYQQPDGLYAIWSTIVTDFVYLDCTADEIAEVWKEEFGNSGMSSLQRAMDIANGKLKHPLGRTFESCLRLRDEQHGRHNEADGLEGQEMWYIAWLGRMRDLVQRQQRAGA